MEERILNNNALALIGLCNEYYQALENSRESMPEDFIDNMLRLLPRIYISVSDVSLGVMNGDAYLDSYLEEDYYESIRRNVENLLGPNDTYLEVFEENMKYSDTPIATSISEGLTDIFQVMYNFIETIKDAPEEFVADGVMALKEDFEGYWSRILCNVLRALNNVKYFDK